MEFQIYTDEERDNVISIIKNHNLPIKMKVEGIFPQRSVNQNAYGHKMFSLYGEKIGMTMKEVKDEMQKKYLLIKEKLDENKVIYVVRSTAGLNTVEWEQFMEKVRMHAMGEHGIYLPDPSEIFMDEENLELKLL